MKFHLSVIICLIFSISISSAAELDYYNSFLIRGDKENFIAMPEGSFDEEVQNIIRKEKTIKQISADRQNNENVFNENEGNDVILSGRKKYNEEDYAGAVDIWKELLYSSQYKDEDDTISVLYSIGYVDAVFLQEYDEAINYLEKVRKMPKINAYDFGTIYSGDLYCASLGWQAYAEYKKGDYISSMKHYMTLNDTISLSHVCKKALDSGDDVIIGILNDSLLKKVLIAWAVSRREDFWGNYVGHTDDIHSYYDDTRNLLVNLFNTIETIDDIRFFDVADKLAWAFYNKGDLQSAQKWVDASSKDSEIALWVQAKLFIHYGDISDAVDILKELVNQYEENREGNNYFFNINRDEARQRIYAEIAFLLMGIGNFEEAMDYSIKSRYWKDIAYIAEKVLTLGELESYINRCEKSDMVYNNLKYLAARRFARDGQWQKAIQCMPDKREKGYYYDDENEDMLISIRLKMEEFYKILQNAQNTGLSNSERAKNYYDAAEIMREYGMEMTGTELEPDWLFNEGDYYWSSSIEHRFSILDNVKVDSQIYAWGPDDKYIREQINEIKQKRNEIEMSRDFFTGTIEEENRALESLPRINKRFQYRYEAAELMEKCAELLPDNDLLKAKALYMAGMYLKLRDVKSADKYYKQLVKTCSETKIGKVAKQVKWFPKPETIGLMN